jgi:hypothetical protein
MSAFWHYHNRCAAGPEYETRRRYRFLTRLALHGGSNHYAYQRNLKIREHLLHQREAAGERQLTLLEQWKKWKVYAEGDPAFERDVRTAARNWMQFRSSYYYAPGENVRPMGVQRQHMADDFANDLLQGRMCRQDLRERRSASASGALEMCHAKRVLLEEGITKGPAMEKIEQMLAYYQGNVEMFTHLMHNCNAKKKRKPEFYSEG